MNYTKNYIQKAIDDLGFTKYTEIQSLVIPKALSNKNIVGCSQTGTGKTHAFLIPIFEKLNEDLKDVQVVILSPTRELADQIYRNATHMAKFSQKQIDIRKYVGGTDRDKEVSRLEKSQPQIVIGTPGKIKDLAIDKNKLNVFKAKTFIIDEADMALEIGFLEDIDKVAGSMKEEVQMMVFSATIPESLRPFLRKYITAPEEIYIKPRELSSLNIEHTFINIKSDEKINTLNKVIQVINPYIGLIFCNKKETVDEIASHLFAKGYKVGKLHGSISPRERKQVMRKINTLEYQYVVVSDIASRGIDIDGVSHVINYELPQDMEFYIHRTGRTGRAAYTGEAITLYTPKDDRYLDFLEGKGIKIIYKEVKNGELVIRKDRKERQKREKVTAGFDKFKLNVKKNDKKVKPGYKKKYHKTLTEAKKRSIRKRGK